MLPVPGTAATTIGKLGYHFEGDLFCFKNGPDLTSRLFINEQWARVYDLEETFSMSNHSPSASYTLVKEVCLDEDPNDQPANKKAKTDDV